MQMKKYGKTEVGVAIKKEHKLLLTSLAWRKMRAYTKVIAKEVGWLGFCHRAEDDPMTIVCTDVVIPRQNTTGTTTEIQPEHMAELFELWGGNQEALDKMDTITLWGHSHDTMAPGPSGQDDSQFQKFIEGGKPFFVRLIMNRAGEVKVDIADMEQNILTMSADIDFLQEDDFKIPVEVLPEMATEDIPSALAHGITGLTLTNIGDELVLVSEEQGIVFRGLSLTFAQKFEDGVSAMAEAEAKEKVLPFRAQTGTYAYQGYTQAQAQTYTASKGEQTLKWLLGAYIGKAITPATPYTWQGVKAKYESNPAWRAVFDWMLWLGVYGSTIDACTTYLMRILGHNHNFSQIASETGYNDLDVFNYFDTMDQIGMLQIGKGLKEEEVNAIFEVFDDCYSLTQLYRKVLRTNMNRKLIAITALENIETSAEQWQEEQEANRRAISGLHEYDDYYQDYFGRGKF